jgi:hypothetical protein
VIELYIIGSNEWRSFDPFFGSNKLPRKGNVFLFTVESRPQKSVQKFMHTPWYMSNICYIVGKQWGCPVVAYCSPNSLLKEAALPPGQIRH